MNGTLTPAYARDYTSRKTLLADWNAGRDFMLNLPNGGGYINRKGAEEMGMTSFQVRWKRNTQVAVIKFSTRKGEWV